MKKSMLVAAILAALAIPQVAGAEGFGIVEWSTEGVAMGGARMFADNDPANMAYNPASITKVNGKALKMGVTYISPHGKHTVDGVAMTAKGIMPVQERSGNQVNPGFVPGLYYVQQMTDKDWWGVGTFTRYGLISGRKSGTWAAFDNWRAKMIGLSVTPTYAHKFDKKWTAGVGADINYVGLEMRKDLSKVTELTGGKQLDIDGKTTALGWNAGVNYAFDDKNEVGVSYRSKIKHSMNAHAYLRTVSGKVDGDAYGIVTLPDQWNIGYSHKFDQKNRVELSAMRTNWHTYDKFDIAFSANIPLNGQNPKNYSDTWRYGIGYEHAFSKKYTGMVGFSFDDHGIPSYPQEGGDFICPTGIRRTYSAGVRYNDDKQAVAFAIGWQKIGDNTFPLHGAPGALVAKGYDNFAKIFSVSYEYHF